MTPENSNQSFPEPVGAPLSNSEPAPVVAVQAFGEDSTRPNKFSRWLALSFLCVCVLVAAGVRLRLLDFPLERDEGEYAYAGQLIRAGIPPYELVYNMKMPGIYLAYAGLMTLFGETTAGIHFGLLIVHLATLAVLFLIARKLLDLPGAVIATAAYALMTLSPAYLGLAAHATHFVMLPGLLGIWMALRMENNGRAWEGFFAGCLFGTAFLMKQQGMFFGMFGGLWLAWVSLAGKMAWPRMVLRLGLYGLGCLLPFLAVCLWLKIAGVFPQFWFWTISYAREYVGIFSLHEGVERAKAALARILHAAPLIWMIAAGGLACLGLTRLALNPRLFLGGFLLFSALAVCPGFYFREHYFIVVVPAVALLAGLAISWSGRRLAQGGSRPWLGRLPLLLALAAGGQSLWADRAVLFSLSPIMACRAVYGVNPFPESPAIAVYLAANTRPDDRVVVIGSEPQIYFLAHRHSSTGHVYTLPLLQSQPFAHTMQEDMIREIEQNPPACLVLVSIPASWGFQPDSSHRLSDWVAGYVSQNMRQTGLIQYAGSPAPEIVWGPAASTAPLRSEYYVAIFKRREAGELTADTPARAPGEAAVRNKLLMQLFYQAQDDALINKFQDALRLNPENPDALNNLGVLLTKQGQIDEAIAQFQQALRRKPDDADLHYNLGNALLKKGQIADTIGQFQTSIRLKPDYAPAHYNLGIALLKQGQIGAAIGEFQEAIRLQPDYAIAHNSLGIALAAQGRLDEAISQFQAALQIKPDFISAQNNLVKARALKNK